MPLRGGAELALPPMEYLEDFTSHFALWGPSPPLLRTQSSVKPSGLLWTQFLRMDSKKAYEEWWNPHYCINDLNFDKNINLRKIASSINYKTIYKVLQGWHGILPHCRMGEPHRCGPLWSFLCYSGSVSPVNLLFVNIPPNSHTFVPQAFTEIAENCLVSHLQLLKVQHFHPL